MFSFTLSFNKLHITNDCTAVRCITGNKLSYPVPIEICGIPYMKKVAEFREIPRNFTELYDTEFGGIPPEFKPIPHGIRNRRK